MSNWLWKVRLNPDARLACTLPTDLEFGAFAGPAAACGDLPPTLSLLGLEIDPLLFDSADGATRTNLR
jgi:hypothetical protein